MRSTVHIMKALRDKLANFINAVLYLYAKAVYYESPVDDEEGNIIGYEWHGLRSGGGRVNLDSRGKGDDSLMDQNS